MSYLDKLRISPITLVLELHEGFKPEAFSGDTIRRMLENRFKLIDITRKKAGHSGNTFFRADAISKAIADPADSRQVPQTPPRGYALAITMEGPETTIYVHISLFGYFRDALPFLLPQFRPMFAAQFGDTLSISAILDAFGRPIRDMIPLHEISLPEMQRARMDHSRMGVHFVTPSLLYHRQNYDGQMRFPDLIKKLEQRAKMISHFYCDGPKPLDEFQPEMADKVKVSEIQLKWHYNKPQDKNYSVMGYTGYVIYAANPDVLQHYLPMLLLGQWLQVGEKTNFGGGKYLVDHGHYTFV